MGYNIKNAFIQIWRNKGMALASILAITAMMMVFGLFLILILNVNLFTEMLKSNYNQVEFFLEDSVTKEDAEQLIATIETYGGVKESTYRTKEDAMNIMRKRWGEKSYLLDTLGENPLPSSILITVDSMEAANNITVKAKELEGIEDIKYYKEIEEKLTRFSNVLQAGSLAVIAFMLIVSIMVVANTIKLTVVARAKEIEIMKYIGATNWFVRGPFLVEGIIIGIISSLLAVGATYFIYKEVIALVGKQFMTIMSSPLVPADYMAKNLIIIFVAIGVSIGACGSIGSMRKFLDA